MRASSSHRPRRASRPLMSPSCRIGSAIARAAVKRGLRLSVGSWNTIWMRLRSGSRAKACGRMLPISSPSKLMRPEVWSSRRITIIDVVDLPQPDSPTRPTLSPWPTVKLMPSTARNISGSTAGLRPNSLDNVGDPPWRGYSLMSLSMRRSGRAIPARASSLPHCSSAPLRSSPPGLTRGSISFDDSCATGWIAGSSPAMTDCALGDVSSSGSSSRRDTPRRGVARISLRV